MFKWVFSLTVVLIASGIAAAFWWGMNRPQILRHPGFGTDCDRLATLANVEDRVDCIRVWYGTNRVLETAPHLAANDGVDVTDGTEEDSRQLHLGRADIWLPKLIEDGGNREIGDTPHVQGPTPSEASELAQYVFLTRITSAGPDRFVTTLQGAIDEGGENAILLFIHGFNVEFDEALIRTAQLSHDLSANEAYAVGAPVLFSWPSAGALSLDDYRGDRDRSLGAAPYLESFLDLLTSELEAAQINIIAHSMGNRVLTQALEDYARDYLERHQRDDLEFRIMLVAADVERDVFDRANIMFDNLDANVTIYTSDKDRALHVSTWVNEENRRRLGDTNRNRPYIRADQNYQTIDATAVATELFGFGLGHNYYSDNPTILWDMMCTIGETAPQDRALEMARFGDEPDGAPYFRINTNVDPQVEACKLRRSAYLAGKGDRVPVEERIDDLEPAAVPPPPPGFQSMPPLGEEETVPITPQATSDFIVFYVDNYDLLDLSPYEPVLQSVVEDGRRINAMTIRVYSDTVGSHALNLVRTERFAQAVRRWFADAGIDPSVIRVEGFGETDLFIATEDEVVERLNRRVELEVVYGE
ncbi:MAG: alpha/beta hydrolase [Pseudomonadota bacterium]